MTRHADNLNSRRRKHAEVQEFLEKTEAALIEREPRVNALIAWLEARKGQNGFGDDFEVTLHTPRRHA